MPLTAGTRLGPYEIVALLGGGGMATVYLAEDPKHGRRVAIKVLHPELAHVLGSERFLHEITTTANLRHPHILPLHDSGEAGGLLYYVMPYVEGESLRDRLTREKQLPLEEALQIAREVADALSYAHSRGVIHRDIKPENILLEGGHAMVADFGIARAVSAAGAERLTGTGVTLGTPAYMSPEQATGGAVDARSDLYSLGCLVYEMLAGEPPYTGPTAESLVHQHLSAPLPDVRQLRPGVSGGTSAVLMRALAKAPADRQATVSDLVRSLAAEMAPRESPAISTSPMTATVPVRGRPAGRRTRWALAVGLGVISVAVLIVTVLLPRSRQPRDAVTMRASAVAILEFENATGDASLDWLKRAVVGLLTSALTQSTTLDIFDTQRLLELAAQDRGSTPASAESFEFLRRAGMRRAISGSILRSNGRLRLQGSIIDLATGRVIRAARSEGPVEGDLFALVGGLIPDLQAALEVDLAGNKEAEAWLREITTSSVDAYRLQLQGHQALVAGRWVDARRSLEEAVALDTNFVAAWADLVGSYWNLGDRKRLDLARERMKRLRDRTDMRSRIRIDQMEAIVGGDAQEVIRTSTALIQAYPENRFYRYLLGRGYHTSGEHRRCIETLAPLMAQRYEWPWTYMLTSRSYRALGVHDSAEVALRLGLEVTGSNPELSLELAQMLAGRGDREGSRRALEAGRASAGVAQSPIGHGQILYELGRLNAEDGRADSARAQLERSLALLPSDEPRREEARRLLRRIGP